MRQSCAIGPCPEKTYNHSEGVKFYNIRNISDPETKKAWKKKILSTRADLKSADQIKDAVICSRHFENGDKRNLPTIIPRKVGKDIVWPETSDRRLLIRRQLSFSKTSAPSVSSTSTHVRQSSESVLQCKINTLKRALDTSPPQMVSYYYYNHYYLYYLSFVVNGMGETARGVGGGGGGVHGSWFF